MNFGEYQALARRTQNLGLTARERLMHSLHGLASEVGEIHSIYQKSYQGHEIKIDDVIDETGDLLWFASELCDVLRVPMDDVARRNIEKLRARYPDGFDVERSLHRDSEE